MKFTALVLLLLSLSLASVGQTPYGNDWINFNQKYYKIKVSEDGVYRITYDELVRAGAPVSQINPKSFQIFNKGLEVSLYVPGEQDGTFDSGDFIEFYGEKNDGKLDKPLYPNPADQPSEYFSLYTDTAAYFLTWSSSTKGKRYSDFSATSTGLTPESYFMHSSVSFFTDGGYYPGAYILAETSVSEYTAGEGILGRSISPDLPQVRTVATPSLFTDLSLPIIAETYVAGRSNSTTSNPQGYNHHLRFSFSNSGGTYVTRKDTLYRSYGVAKNTFNLNPSDIGNTTYVTISAINDIGSTTDYQAPGYIKITYPRKFDLTGTVSLKFTLKGSNSDPNSLVRFTNSSISSPVILDLTNNRRIAASTNAGVLESAIPGAGIQKDLFLYSSQGFKTASLQPVSLTNFDPANFDKNFLIITHSSLSAKASDYADYRNSTGYKTLLVTTDQLYDQFYYGIHHPLAIRNFCKYLLHKAMVKPEYLLLLGKGQSHFSVRTEAGFAKDLVPVIGNPPSDNMFTSGLHSSSWEPEIATGRIAARTPQEVDIYLEKLKIYESQPDSLYRKRFIHVSGGSNLFENLQWIGYQNGFLSEADKVPFGAESVNFQKNVSEPVTDNITGKIISEINKGASLLSFFGHGSSQATEINFGEPNFLSNQNKLLVYMINGCNAGNPFTDASLGERMIFEPLKAAVGWLATSDEGVASYLAEFSKIFYRNSFNLNYGKPIAYNLKTTIGSYQRTGDLLNQTHSRQYLWQGDPALRFYAPPKPDFYIRNKDLFIYPSNTSTKSDSFAVAIIAKNLGKAINNSLSVSVRQTLPDNSEIVHAAKLFKPVYNTDTLYYYITPDQLKMGGNNKFTITLDSDNTIDELNEGNNSAEFSFFMPSNGINILFPINNSIVNAAPVTLRAQSLNLLSEEKEYVFEIDTIISFNSSWKKTSGIIRQSSLPSWTPEFAPVSNKVYYWRVKLNLPENDGGLWQTAAFTYLAGSLDGWNQSHKDQFATISNKGMYFDYSNNRFAFENTVLGTSIRTRGDDASTAEERAFRSKPGGRLGYGGFDFDGLAIIAYNPQTLTTFSYPSVYNLEGFYRYSGEFHFNPNNPAELDSLIEHINRIPSGYYVIGHNGRNLDLKSLPPDAKAAFSSLGLIQFSSVAKGEPYMFWGQRGTTPGSAIEKLADPTANIPATAQSIYFEKEYQYPFTQGSVQSEKIGPAKEWNSIELNFEKDATDILQVDLFGVQQNGQEELVRSNIPATSFNISDLDPSRYPFIKIKASATDETLRTPSQLKSWRVFYTPYPEATINTTLKNVFHAQSIAEGDSLKWQLAYQNISKQTTDSISVYYTLTKSDRSTVRSLLGTFGPINSNESITADLRLPTSGLSGSNLVKMEFQAKNGRDLLDFNNFLTNTFSVIKDTKEPLVDVFFDGKKIVNSELVSPSPLISINVIDDNKYLLLTDTTSLEVYLKEKDDDLSDFKRVYYSSNKLSFRPATSTTNNKAVVDFVPERFDDGTYTLKLRSKDASGTFNTSNDFEIDFSVVNESAITNFYPYPNPFTSRMKFVFTLTGDKIPDKIKIQILTATGKIVREIMKEELGALRIGNNISDFSWDGTDQFGDRLANGVYFYRVLVENNDKTSFKHKVTASDKSFKNDFGKIYLMR